MVFERVQNVSPHYIKFIVRGGGGGGATLTFLITKPILRHIVRWKGLLKREIMKLGTKFQAEIVACKSWPVVQL